MPTDTKNDDLKKRALDFIKLCKADMETLQTDRAKYHSFYMSAPLGNEVEGRSKVVMSDVADTVESIMPSLMRIFYGGEQVVQVQERGGEDEEKARFVEEKLNFDFQIQNEGFKIFYDWFKDALLYKMGVVKYWWESKEEYENKEFREVPPEGLIVFESAKDFIIDDAMLEPSGITYTVKGRKVKKISRPVIENVPPEEFIFNTKSKSLDEAVHRIPVKRSELKKYGVDNDMTAEIARFSEDAIAKERFSDLGGVSFLTESKDSDKVWLYECFLNDYDDEGNASPKKITIIGDTVIDVEDNEYGRPPFCVLSPVRIPHRVIGRGMAELVLDIQKLRTALMRYILDNVYFQNNGMRVVNPFRVSLDDLMNGNRPGGIIRTLSENIDPSSGIFPVPVTPLPSHILTLMEQVEIIKENRTGVTRYNQGLDARSLNKTASGISQIMGAAQQRMELLARLFAETGVKDLFSALVEMNLKFFDIEQAIKISGKWQFIKPEDISGEYDLIVDVGIGTGTKEQHVAKIMQMFGVYGQIGAMLGPAAQEIFSPENLKRMVSKIWESMGYKNVGQFVAPDKDTEGTPPPPPPPDPGVMLAAEKLKIEQMNAETNRKKAETERIKAQTEGLDMDERINQIVIARLKELHT